MIVQSFLGGRPGQRIQDYRNSMPRYVKVLAIGKSAESIISSFNRDRENILTTGPLDPDGRQPMDEPVNGIRPNAVIVVYQKGEEVRFPFQTERTASMLSFVVLEEPDGRAEREPNKTLQAIQKIADLFVTTSDQEFVNELIDNLAN
ncbi:hypothetical protein HGP14_08875 [Rhizobium sp. P32RR-XVIII]|uniref:hypothetical protein n=1 Tax=Rhizobium sp. P32RR-XVIII TaxID=2726738 RepID=UPI00145737B2|nr:hypothetical protein [Rhizobium sp. P32RR-XVIII]NLS03475.1 hypothetical protein [Rhizobium sp. P32RR-XVIII]